MENLIALNELLTLNKNMIKQSDVIKNVIENSWQTGGE